MKAWMFFIQEITIYMKHRLKRQRMPIIQERIILYHFTEIQVRIPTPQAECWIYSEGGEKEQLAENILDNLTDLGFKDLGIIERPNLVVLKRTNMPAVLIETGFINNDSDNEKFDDEFEQIAAAIADGILKTIGSGPASRDNNVQPAPDESNIKDPYEGLYEKDRESSRCTCDKLYRVQVGAFRNRDNADRLLEPLLDMGYPAFIIYQDDLYKVQVGAYKNLDNAVDMERKLRKLKYNTYITI